MQWIADLKCNQCDSVDSDRSFDADDQDEAALFTRECPNCGTEDGLEVIAATLRESS